jgi:sec-independent protein translocase protein TatC
MEFLSATIVDAGAKDGREASLNFIDVSSAFDLLVQVSVTTGIVLASPVWITQLWGFIRPALKKKEARMGGGFILVATPLFIAGCVAGAVLLPHIVEVMTGFANDGTTSQISARAYFDFVLKLIIAVGAAFALPVILVFLNFGGVLSGKTMAKSWRIALLSITLFSAIATPAADVISMFLLAAPMLLLYLSAVGIALVRDKRQELRVGRLELA